MLLRSPAVLGCVSQAGKFQFINFLMLFEGFSSLPVSSAVPGGTVWMVRGSSSPSSAVAVVKTSRKSGSAFSYSPLIVGFCKILLGLKGFKCPVSQNLFLTRKLFSRLAEPLQFPPVQIKCFPERLEARAHQDLALPVFARPLAVSLRISSADQIVPDLVD